MDYESYMMHTCVWNEFLGEDEDTRSATYGPDKIIKCFKSGKNKYIREEGSGTLIVAKPIVVMDSVKGRDKIDSQVVKSINEIPDFDRPDFPIRECLTWDD
jgi:hypothetical protein